jgi:hypothetical protein
MVQYMRVMNLKCPTAIKGTMSHAKPSFSTRILAGAIISVVPCLAPLRYSILLNSCYYMPSSAMHNIRT